MAAIVAVDNNWGIGYQGQLLERIPDDLKAFKGITNKGTVVMGRKTWDSLPVKPLSDRTNIIITRNPIPRKGLNVGNFDMPTFKSLLPHLNGRIFVIGGESIYKQLLPYCDYVYLTRIYKDYENVDAYFPALSSNKWKCVYEGDTMKHNDIPYQFFVYERI